MKSILKSDYITFLIGLTLGLMFIILPTVGYKFNYFPGDLGDGRLNLYFLEHSYKFLTFQLAESYWDAPFMFPAKDMLTYSDNLLGSAPFYGIFRLLGFNIFTSYQLWFILVSILNYFAAYLLFNKISKNKYAAVLGAMTFAFSLALVSQLAHAQMFTRLGIPLAFYMAVNFHTSLSAKSFFWMVFFVVLQIYCGVYLGFLLMVPLAIFFIYTLCCRFKSLKKHIRSKIWLTKICAGLIFNGTLLFWLIYPYLIHSKSSGKEPYQGVFDTLPTLKSYFMVGHGSLIWNKMVVIGSSVANRWDFEIFPGLFAILGLLFLFLFPLWKKITKQEIDSISVGLIISAVMTFILFLKFGDQSLYFLVYNLPGYSAMRSMARIINVELIFFGLGVTLLFTQIIKGKSVKAYSLFLISACLLTIDNYSNLLFASRTTKATAEELLCTLQESFNLLPSGSVVSYEPSELESNVIYYHISAMLASQENDIKVINGYSGNSPVGFDRFWHDIDADTRNYWLSFNTLNFDTLYIFKPPREYLTLSSEDRLKQTDKLKERNFQIKVEEKIKAINFNKNWVNMIQKKAVNQKISLDSAIYNDAVWMINHEKEKRLKKQVPNL